MQQILTIKQMKKKIPLKMQLFICLLLNFCIIIPKANGAEKISLVYGIFGRTINIELIEKLAKTGKAEGSLKNLLKLNNINEKEIQELLNQSYDLKLVTTSKLMYSKIGKVLILRLAKIIYPNKLKNTQIAIPAIRSGVIKGIVEGNGKLNLIQFLKSYPNKVMAINISALLKILNKVESMSELIQFFSDSPLEEMKKSNVRD